MKIPRESIDLIHYLDTLYPDRMDIDDTKSDKERYRLEGKVELLRDLKQSLEQLQEKEVSCNSNEDS